MKLRVIDRVLIALSGLFLLALSVWLALDAMGRVQPLVQYLQAVLSIGANRARWLVVGACAVPALLGVFNCCVLFRRGKGKRGFIAQRSENGEISISVKTIETLVTKCAQKHGEIAVQSVTVEQERSGLLIKLRAALPSGMNIPLAVGTLQKQIKQYITACSGVDVSEVRVKVESTDRAASNSPYAVPDDAAALPVEQPEPAPMPVEAVTPVELPEEEPEPVPDEREFLTHQRLFSTQEEPAIVPEPPEQDVSSQEEIQAEAEEAMAEAAAELEQQEAEWEAAAGWAEQHEAEWDEAAAQADEPESEPPQAEESDQDKKTEE